MRRKDMKENKIPLEQLFSGMKIQSPSAEIRIGTGLVVELYNITFTKRQIKNIKKYFAWDAKNLEEK